MGEKRSTEIEKGVKDLTSGLRKVVRIEPKWGKSFNIFHSFIYLMHIKIYNVLGIELNAKNTVVKKYAPSPYSTCGF